MVARWNKNDLSLNLLFLSSEFWVGNIPESVGNKVEGKNGKKDGEAGEEGEPGSIGELIQPLADHGAPAWGRGPNAQSDKTEACFHDNGRGNPEGSHDQEFSQDIGQDMNEHDFDIALSDGSGRFNKLLPLDGEG